jgi:hypothetical protein
MATGVDSKRGWGGLYLGCQSSLQRCEDFAPSFHFGDFAPSFHFGDFAPSFHFGDFAPSFHFGDFAAI